MRAVPFLVAAVALAACVPGRAGFGGLSAGDRLAISGEVDLAALPAGRAVGATLADVTAAAAISLLDPASGNTVKTALTNASGVFLLAGFGSAFAPATGALYYLEAVKGLGSHAVGRNAARLRTLLRWSGTGWESLTAGTVKVGLASTALAALYGLKSGLAANKRISAADLVGTLGSGGFSPVTNASVAEYTQARALVGDLLAADEDPLANLGYNQDSGSVFRKIVAALAPDDTGDPAVTHDYVVTKGGVQSTFVWIPVFTAYQLIVPANCGAENGGKPVGYWVAGQPSAGTQDTDWAREQFGGFYAGKYEASRADATPGDPVTGAGATAGSGSTLKVARYCVPWTDINWDTAALACLAYDSHAHLLRDDEWTALAVWATIQGKTVYGNNREDAQGVAYGVPADVDDTGITFRDDPTFAWSSDGVDRALTGTGTRSTWVGAENLTTHTGTSAGVHDLNGNVWEWTGAVGAAITTGNYVLHDINTASSVGDGFISALSTDPRLRRLGLPGASAGATALLGGDRLWKNTANAAKALRGGGWTTNCVCGGTANGIWALSLYHPRTLANAGIGFRPALRY